MNPGMSPNVASLMSLLSGAGGPKPLPPMKKTVAKKPKPNLPKKPVTQRSSGMGGW